MQLPEDILTQAVEKDSAPKLIDALDLARSLYTEKSGAGSYSSFVSEALRQALEKPSVPLVNHLFQAEQVQLQAAQVSMNASRDLIEALTANGWDVNRSGPQNQIYHGRRLIDYLVGPCYNEDLTRWLVETKGAHIDGGQQDDEYVITPMPPPILESCAEKGSVSLFKFMQERGAKLSSRTLHRAAASAAATRADPGRSGGFQGEHSKKVDRAEMLRFLVDEIGLDVNAMDSELNHGMGHWGTPVCYAAKEKNGAPVVRWFLEKGASPDIEGPYTGYDAWGLAKLEQCDEVLKVLEEWKATKESSQA